MNYPEACKASPLNAARNTTGSDPVVMWDKDGDGTYEPFGSRPGTGELERMPLNAPLALGVDPDAWEPLMEWPGGREPVSGPYIPKA